MSDVSIAERVQQAKAALKSLVKDPLPFSMVSCLGFEPFSDWIRPQARIPFREIEGFPAADHASLVIANVEQGQRSPQELLLLDGGHELYQGRSSAQACIPIWALARIGIEQILIVNAASGLHPHHRAGDFMWAHDHIDFAVDHPLRGEHAKVLGPQFPDMSRVYCAKLRARFEQAAKRALVTLHGGTIAHRPVPTNGTPAELHFLRTTGADAVADSGIPEAIVAKHAGLSVGLLSVILDTNPKPHRATLSLDAMVEAAERGAEQLSRLWIEFLRQLPTL